MDKHKRGLLNMEAEKKNKRMRRRRFRNMLSLILLIGVFLLWGFYALLESDLFNLKYVELYGNSIASYEEVLEASKLILHRNLFKYDLDMVEQQVIQHPYIKEVEAARKLPNKLVINVQEREEYAIISYMGSYVYVDHELVALKIADSYIAQEQPLITGVELQSLKVGDPLRAINQEDLQKAIMVLAAAEVSDMIDIVSELDTTEEGNIIMHTIDGIEVHLGNVDDPVYSMLVLKEVLVKLYTSNRRNVIIDLRYEGTSTVRDRD